tara:strand:- start:32908 stop:33540 length:633 start_codon:yes stop_codon:yes gene_type:complete
MARKPVHLTMKSDKASGRQAIWQGIRKLKRFTAAEVWHETKEERATIRTYLTSLERGGYVVEVEMRAPKTGVLSRPSSTRYKERVYKLARDVGIEAPRLKRDGTLCIQGLVREQMWRSIKLLADFTPRDLAIFASTENQPVSGVDAGNYLGHLFRAGYLTIVEASTHQSQARYRFVRARDTGPRPPMVQRLKTVFDPNTCKIMWQEGGGE